MASIKIKTVIIDNEPRVPPICFKLLTDFAGHRDCCDECHKAFYDKSGKYCITGRMIFEELLEQPEVSLVPD